MVSEPLMVTSRCVAPWRLVRALFCCALVEEASAA
jgi:hypothetical protein